LACFFFLLLTFVLSRNWTFSIFIPMNRKEKENRKLLLFRKNDSCHEEMFLASHVRRSNPLASCCFFLLFLILFEIEIF
jgi:hypothetical protein